MSIFINVMAIFTNHFQSVTLCNLHCLLSFPKFQTSLEKSHFVYIFLVFLISVFQNFSNTLYEYLPSVGKGKQEVTTLNKLTTGFFFSIELEIIRMNQNTKIQRMRNSRNKIYQDQVSCPKKSYLYP